MVTDFRAEGTSPRRVAPAAGSTREIWSLAFSPDGTSLASAADDHTIKLWDVATGRERATLEGHVNLGDGGRLVARRRHAGFCRLRRDDPAVGCREWRALDTLRGHADRVRNRGVLARRDDARIGRGGWGDPAAGTCPPVTSSPHP